MANLRERLKAEALRKKTVPHPLCGAAPLWREDYLQGLLMLRASCDETLTAPALASSPPCLSLFWALGLREPPLERLAAEVLDMDDSRRLFRLKRLFASLDTPVRALLFLCDMVRLRGAGAPPDETFLTCWESVATLLHVRGELRRQVRDFCGGLAAGVRTEASCIPPEVTGYYFGGATFDARRTTVVASARPVSAGVTMAYMLPGGVMLVMNWVEPGSFSRKGHTVTLTRGYWLGRYPFTQGQWNAAGARKRDACRWTGDRLPVENVSWDEAMACCGTLNGLLRNQLPQGYRFTLPTEAQWEFAARGGLASRGYEYSGGDDLGEVGWYDGNSWNRTHPVGEKKPNELGFFDMSGNVREWCMDWYGDYPPGDVTDPAGPGSGSRRVVRGGGYYSAARSCACAYRLWDNPDGRDCGIGFRVALASFQ